MEIKKIFFDMDGVLADFDRGVRELCGMEPAPQGVGWKPGADAPMWAKIREVEHYYDRLELMPGAKHMFDTLRSKYGDRVEILTAIPKPDKGILTADEDKRKWVRRLLSTDVVINIVYRAEKPSFCTGKDCILIDDFIDNVEAWEACGGTGICFTSAEDVLEKVERLEVNGNGSD